MFVDLDQDMFFDIGSSPASASMRRYGRRGWLVDDGSGPFVDPVY